MAPLRLAAMVLAAHAPSNQVPQPLPVVRSDQVGDLSSAFNRLLQVLGQREKTLAHGTELLDHTGELAKNGGWSWRVGRRTGAPACGHRRGFG